MSDKTEQTTSMDIAMAGGRRLRGTPSDLRAATTTPDSRWRDSDVALTTETPRRSPRCRGSPRGGGSCGVETQLGMDLPVAAEVPNGGKLPGCGLKDSLATDWLIFTGPDVSKARFWAFRFDLPDKLHESSRTRGVLLVGSVPTYLDVFLHDTVVSKFVAGDSSEFELDDVDVGAVVELVESVLELVKFVVRILIVAELVELVQSVVEPSGGVTVAEFTLPDLVPVSFSARAATHTARHWWPCPQRAPLPWWIFTPVMHVSVFKSLPRHMRGVSPSSPVSQRLASHTGIIVSVTSCAQETAASAAKQKLSKLQEDFKYNLKLLEGRDEELALYDANFASLKNVLRDREAELSELRAREAELQAELQRAKQRTGDQEVQYQQKLKDARAQMEGARWKFDDELRRQQDAMETLRRNMERQLREKDEDVENQRRELTVTFDDVMRQREAEFKRASDELQAKVRELELKNKALVREADAQRDRADEMKTKNENLQQMLQDNDKEMKSLEWTLADVRAAKDAKVGELESEVAKLTEVKQKLLDEYETKMAELLQSLHSVEKAFVQQKAQYDEELQRHIQRKESEAQEASARNDAKLEALTARLRESEERVETLQAELKQAKWDADDKLIEKEREVERIKSALQDLEDEQQRTASDLQKQLRAGDRETQALQERLQDSQRQISLLKEKDKAQRQELLEGVEKQEDLQRELLAVNLRWENRWQDQQQELDERHELKVRELQQVKERLLSEKEATEERLLHAENEMQRLRSELSSLKSSARITESFGSQYMSSAATRSREERNSAESAPVAPSPLWSDDPGTLSPVPGVSPLLTDSPQLRVKAEVVNSTGALEMENAKLRDLIRQMKESLAQQAQEMETSPGQSSGNRSVSKLAAQLLEAQERCVALEARLDEAPGIKLQLESCKRELLEAQRVIEAKTKQVTELEARLRELEGVKEAGPELQSGRVALEAQLTDFKRKLEAANNDIDRLVRERSQLMELSNQLRADLRRSGSGDAGSRASTPRVEFAGKKDYENLIAELTHSLEEARVHNKTLKKELRRMVKLQVQFQQERGGNEGQINVGHTTFSHEQVSQSSLDRVSNGGDDHRQNESTKRRSSTLSMMRSLDPSAARRSTRSSTTTVRSVSDCGDSAGTSKGLDEQLLALARNKRPSDRTSSTKSRRSTRAVPSTISEHATESEGEADVSAEDRGESEAGSEKEAPSRLSSTRSSDKSPLARLFHGTDRRDSAGTEDSNATIGGTASTKVTDARLKLQQAKEMLMLSGKRAPITGSRASLATFAASAATGAPTTARLSDRETSSQRSAVKKLKQLQSKRAEMVNERKKVRNYSLAS
ncbi:unnamed protein product [Phytophthora lilii]|uniref:Unnamed protein product n=1 Tax=Phytophthora lilii TaxID=2077276 RepID=A0A9W6WS74_9STRA|nr:unnamed protein product [Phytophthora lilii]